MITQRQINLLKEAIDDAKMWRGSIVGCAPQEAIDAFDARIEDMRRALAQVREDRRAFKMLSLKVMFLATKDVPS